MKLLFLIGSGAVGKMTVGQELVKRSDFRLFHNHITIEPVLEIFGDFNEKVIKQLRDVIFEEFAQSAGYGMIFTFMWDFDQQMCWDYIEHIKNIFSVYDTEFYYVELVASQAVRLARNNTSNRLHNKASKRDIDISAQRIQREDEVHRLESRDGEIPFANYLKIDNSNLAPSLAAEKILEHFQL